MTNQRKSIEVTWQYLKSIGEVVPTIDGKAYIPKHIPFLYEEEPIGLSFFRVERRDKNLSDLTMPRTYIGRSEFSSVTFNNSDLSDSLCCWDTFSDCDFSDSDLSFADLRASVFERCCFD
jgi:uncharacterized protein YjbI with pentapeptide repeats